jgi:SPP1 gp7 family putative phage head morphogenesis protein
MIGMSPATDARSQLPPREQRLLARQRFARVRLEEASFNRQLGQIAKHIGDLVKGFAPKGVVGDMPGLHSALQRYGNVLHPWATAVSNKMLVNVSNRDIKAWTELGRSVGQELRREVLQAPTGQAMRNLLADQVSLITSLPVKAAERVHKLTLEALLTGGPRAVEIQQMIMQQGHVSRGQAANIAFTEVARSASVLVESRAVWLGSPGYFWRTSRDPDVRPRHRKLEGKFIKWDEPPISGERGERAHAGQIYRCRCWQEPVLPDNIS